MAVRLNEEEQSRLFASFKDNGDIAARNTIAESYLYLADIIAKKFSGRGVDFEDLRQIAATALVKSIERFEPDRGIKFSSFAAPSMIGEVKNYFRDKTRMMHISRRDSEQLMELSSARAKLEQENNGCRASDIAEKMGVSEERVLELLEMQRSLSVSSLEKFAGDDEDTQIGDFIGSDDKSFADIEMNDYLRYAMDKLSPEERTILIERYWKKHSQKQVAEKLGVSQMHISRYEKKILAKLRDFYNE